MKTPANKLFLTLLSIILAFGIFVSACEGPTGEQGPQGPQGPEGPVGPAGEDGSVIHAGEGSPASDLGKIDDFYLDTNVAEMYGPKTQDGWGVPFSLQGPQGDDGQDGSQIFSGTTAPDASQGSEGDYYLNKSTFDLYGPKTGSGWGTPINLQATTNVMYSVWFDVLWDTDTATRKGMRISESFITLDFINSGTVLMYLKQEISSGGVSVVPLPFLDGNDNLYFGMADSPAEDFTGIILVHDSVDGTTPLSNDYTTSEFEVRYVLIPGSEEVPVPEAPGSSFHVDLKDYEQVKKYFGIKAENRAL